jgi:uncharacterized protein YndB with AHSA1/START domain
MTLMSTKHAPPEPIFATMRLKRRLAHAPASVFGAFASEDAKRIWFAGAGNDAVRGIDHYSLDFRIGGEEHARGVVGADDGDGSCGRRHHFTNDGVIHDIVPDARIVYSYRMTMNGEPYSISLAALSIEPASGGSKIELVEHLVFLSGEDELAGRRMGTEALLANVERFLDHA